MTKMLPCLGLFTLLLPEVNRTEFSEICAVKVSSRLESRIGPSFLVSIFGAEVGGAVGIGVLVGARVLVERGVEVGSTKVAVGGTGVPVGYGV
jgi:hypothetical protein